MRSLRREFLAVLGFILGAVLVMSAGWVSAAGTCTTPVTVRNTDSAFPSNVLMTRFTCTADAAAATFPDVEINKVGGCLVGVYIDDGTTAITDAALDIAVKPLGTDVNLLGASGTDVDMAAGYATLPAVTTYSDTQAYLGCFVGQLTVTMSGNLVNSANPQITIINAL